MIEVPRNIADVLAHADELAARFEAFDPTVKDAKPARPLAELRAAVLARATAERAVLRAVNLARRSGQSWSSIGAMIGTTGEAARQRYRDAETQAMASSTADSRVDRHAASLKAAGFTPDELKEFGGLMEFAAVLAAAGHVGLVAPEIVWTPEKAEALMRVLTDVGAQRELPPGAGAGPQIRVRTSTEPPLPFRTNEVDAASDARCEG